MESVWSSSQRLWRSMYNTTRDVLRQALLFTALFVIGSILFAILDKWGLGKSIFFTFTLLTTIGYGADDVDKGVPAHLVAMIMCPLAIFALGYSFRVSDYAIRKSILKEVGVIEGSEDSGSHVVTVLPCGIATYFRPATHRLVMLAATFFGTVLFGTFLFMIFEGYTFSVSLWFCIVTVCTVGFGDVVPESGVGRFFCVVYGLAGVMVFMYLLTSLQMFVQDYVTTRSARGPPRFCFGAACPPWYTVDTYLLGLSSTVLIVFFLCASLTFFALETDWTFYDCMYFCAVALSTVGYGDLVPSYRGVGILFLALGIPITSWWVSVVSVFVSRVLHHSGGGGEGGSMVSGEASVMGELDTDLKLSAAHSYSSDDEDGVLGTAVSEVVRTGKVDVDIRRLGRSYSAPDRAIVEDAEEMAAAADAAAAKSSKTADMHLIMVCVTEVIVFVVMTLLYKQMEDWTFLESMYFSAVTLATVGFGDYVPTTPMGRLLMVFFALLTLVNVSQLLGIMKTWSENMVRKRMRAKATGGLLNGVSGTPMSELPRTRNGGSGIDVEAGINGDVTESDSA